TLSTSIACPLSVHDALPICELNVSHSGARYTSSAEDGDQTASLGIFYDYAYSDPGVKVVEVIEGGPLDRPGMNVRPGAIIMAIRSEEHTSELTSRENLVCRL